ncbi:MAG: type I glutamate--ammonia ligase [Lachnospiraceae bacterium]
MGYTKEEIIRIIEEEDINFIRLQFTDIFGTLKNVAITPRRIAKALDNKILFDGSSIEGFVRIEESDMMLYPDLNSFAIYPWGRENGKVARLICSVYGVDEKPFEGDPRYVLRKAIEHAEELGFIFNVGPECEFFLFNKGENGYPTLESFDRGGYFDLGPNDIGEKARKDIILALEALGFEIETSHHECAPAQHEIDFKYTTAMHAADNIMTFKQTVKAIADNHGLYATFMPKPIFGVAGSGMHLNMSLFKDGKNAFIDEQDRNGLSRIAYSFMAGIMKHIEAMTIVLNPLINSYKRLVPGYEAPIYIAWSTKNRSPLIRVPSGRGISTRIELRSPDPSANPYLALGLCLEAGLEGIEKDMTPPESVDKNIFEMSQREIKRSAIKPLPVNMFDAIGKAEKDRFVREVLGNHIYNKYIEAKRKEWDEYSCRVSNWEIDTYLHKY